MENNIRSTEHKRNTETEQILSALEVMLEHAGQERKFSSELPTVFIVGCARSGTTMLTQFMASSGLFCYPTNFISRFYYNPYIGALLQRLMFDLDKKGELFGEDLEKKISLASNLGKTKGALSPHEFWYFWRRFFEFKEIQKLDEHVIERLDTENFVNGIQSIKHVFNKPIVMKAMIMNWDIPILAKLMPNAYFIFMERNIEHNAYSLIEARRKFFNDVSQWYSFKPPEYVSIKDKPPAEQVVRQVLYTNEAITRGLAILNQSRVIKLAYEEFCKAPSFYLNKIVETIKIESVARESTTVESIRNLNDVSRYDANTWEEIMSAVKKLKAS